MSRSHIKALFILPLVLMACNGSENTDVPELEDSTMEKTSGAEAKWIKETGQNCFTQRFVQPPRNPKSKKRTQFLVNGPWAQYLDLDTLEIELNKKDIDYVVEVENHELRFTNPGKSRAVIDFSYCLTQSPPDDDGDGNGGSSGGDGGGDSGSGDGDSGSDDGNYGEGSDGGAITSGQVACSGSDCEPVLDDFN